MFLQTNARTCTCAGEVVPIAGDVMSPQEYVDAFARLKGAKVCACVHTCLCLWPFFCFLHQRPSLLLHHNTESRPPTRSCRWISFASCPFPARTSSWRCTSGTTRAAPVRTCLDAVGLGALPTLNPPPTYTHKYLRTGEGHTRDPAATRALCPHVRNLEVG